MLLLPDGLIQLVLDFLHTEHLLLVHVRPDKKIKNKTYHRDKIQRKKPSPDCLGILPLEKNHRHGKY